MALGDFYYFFFEILFGAQKYMHPSHTFGGRRAHTQTLGPPQGRVKLTMTLQ